MEKDQSIKKEIQDLDERYEKGDRELISDIQKTASIVLESITASLEKLGALYFRCNPYSEWI